jgi:hypothetical protein
MDVCRTLGKGKAVFDDRRDVSFPLHEGKLHAARMREAWALGGGMNDGKEIAEAAKLNPFELIRHPLRLDIPQPVIDRLCAVAQIPAHYRPTFVNALHTLIAKSHRWHRIASRSVEMDEAAKELANVVRDALKLKGRIDKLSPQARTTLGLYALRLDRYGETDTHEAVREQIEELLQHGGLEQAQQKAEYLGWSAGRVASAATTETWPRGGDKEAARKRGKDRPRPHADTFNHFVGELSELVRACHSPVRFDPDEAGGSLAAFLEASLPFLPGGFVPQEVFGAGEAEKPVSRSPLSKLKLFWSRRRKPPAEREGRGGPLRIGSSRGEAAR